MEGLLPASRGGVKIIKHPEADSIRIEAQVDTTPAYALENIARYISAPPSRPRA
jgi:hypothetical protein